MLRAMGKYKKLTRRVVKMIEKFQKPETTFVKFSDDVIVTSGNGTQKGCSGVCVDCNVVY